MLDRPHPKPASLPSLPSLLTARPHPRRWLERVQRGEISPTTAILKMSKAFERVEAENVLLEKDLEKRWLQKSWIKQPGG